jgi:hypothetical protein
MIDDVVEFLLEVAVEAPCAIAEYATFDWAKSESETESSEKNKEEE